MNLGRQNKKTLVIISILIFGFNNSYSQTKEDFKEIFDLVSKRTGEILYYKPLKYIDKKKLFIPDIKEFIKPNRLDSISIHVILSLANKFKNSDTAKWTYNDFPEKVIISKRDTILTYKKELNRIGYINKVDKKRLRKQINNFNYNQIKGINSISRPLFNDSIDYAVIQIDNCENLWGGGGVILFRKINRKWIDYGMFYSWAC